MSDGGSNPLTNSAPVVLNGGQLNIRHDGDNLADPETISTFAGNNVMVGSPVSAGTAPGATSYASSVNGVFDLRTLSAGSNKTVQFGQLQFGGPLGTASLQIIQSNNYSVEFTGGMSVVKDGYLNLNTGNVIISGAVTGNGTLFKQNAGELDINTTVNTATGGTVLAGGTTAFAQWQGNTRTLNSSTLAAGNVTVQPGAILRFNSTSNVNGGQLVDVRSNLASLGVIGIADNSPLASYHARVPQAAGAFNGNLQTSNNAGSGVLAINAVSTQPVNLATIGDGTWYLGSTTNGVGLNGSYNAATLGAGAAYNFGAGNSHNADPVIRLGGGAQTLFVGSDGTANALSDLTLACGPGNPPALNVPVSLVVGAPLTNSSGGTIANGTGTAILISAQSYTGATLVNRGSTLEFRGAMQAGSYETFGTLSAGGEGGTFFKGAIPIIPLARPGSEIGLRNDFGILPVTAPQGRYGDATPVNLNSSTLRLTGSNAADIREVVGAVSVAGGSSLIPNRSLAGRTTELNVASLTRVGQGQLAISPAVAGQLGSDERVTVAGANLAAQAVTVGGVTNGMVAPWMWNSTDVQFVTYSDFGFVNAGFNMLTSGLVNLPAGTGSERVQINAAIQIAATTSSSFYAVRTDATIGGSNAETLSIGSGGLINANSGVSIFPATNFNGEALIATQGSVTFGAATPTGVPDSNPAGTGKITATTISKTGAGTLQFDTDHTSFSGPIALNQGTLTIRDAALTAGTSNNGGNGSVITINGAGATLNYRADVTGETFNNSIVIAAGNLLAGIGADRAISATASAAIIQVAGGLTFGGAPGDQGQTLVTTTNNTYQIQINGTTNLGPAGNVTFSVGTNTTTPMTLGGTAATGTVALSGAGTLIKTGGTQLNVGGGGVLPTAASTNAGGIIVQQGTLQVNAGTQPAANGNVVNSLLGSGNITMVGGQLSLRLDGDNSATNRVYTFNSTPLVSILGSSTINLDRVTASGGSTKTVAFPQLAIGGQTLTVSNGNSFSLRFEATSLGSTPTFNTVTDLMLSGVTDSGGGLYVVKNGVAQLWFDDRTTGSGTANAVNTFSGGVFVNAGTLRFGNATTESATAQAGSGPIQLNAGAAVRILDDTNIAAGQNVSLLGIAPSLAVVRYHGTNLATGGAGSAQANLQNILSTNSTGGTLRMDTANLAQALDMSLLGDGTLFFSTQGTHSYTANTLGAGAGATYRLGANDTPGTVMTLAPATGNSPVLTGANKVIIGSIGVNGSGTVLLNQTNDYSGGTTIARSSTLQIASGTIDTPLGSGTVDAFGTITAQNASGSFLNAAGTANNNPIVLHPGATLRFENNVTAANNDRWADGAAINLNGATLFMNSLGTGASTETIGSVTFANGARIQPNRSSSGGQVEITIPTGGTFTRSGNATMVFAASGPTQFGLAPGSNSERVIVTDGTAAISGSIVSGMLPAYYISSADSSFVTYGANGFTRVAFTSSQSTPTFAAALPANSIVDVTTASTLSDNPSIYALRLSSTTTSLSSAPGQVNTITLNAGAPAGAGGGIIFSTAATLNTNISFNGFEGLIYTSSSALIAGDISGVSAAGITKFGTGTLTITKDQSDAARGAGAGLNNGWTVNEGTLTANTFGALGNAVGTNTVTLNGSTLNLTANQGNAANQFYSVGDIRVTDNAVINFTPGGSDRTQSLGAAGALSNIVITSTGGALADAQLGVVVNQQRAILQVGGVSVAGAGASAIFNVNQSAVNNNLTSGAGSGLSVAGFAGSDATQTIRKRRNAELYVRGASTFAGNVSIEQGPVGVFSNASLGTGPVTVKRYGTLDVQVANFAPANSGVTYQAGSNERWSVDGARTGAVNLGAAGLQIANDQTGTVAVTMNGGSIEGFVKTDDNVRASNANQGAVYRTLGSGVTFTFAGNSSIGQNINQGVNGLDNGAQPNVFAPTTDALAGVALEIKGAIIGPGSLTKQGFDMVTLSSSANAYAAGTFVTQGLLRAGAANALPLNRSLSTSGSAAFDLNGFNQQIGQLTSPALSAAAVTAGGAAGYVTNTATTIATLTLNSATNATYAGVIQYNVGLTQQGANIQTLANVNTYAGPTVITSGTVAVSVNGAMRNTASLSVSGPGIFDLVGGPGVTDRISDAALVVLAGGKIQTNGNSETFGPLQLTVGTSVIDFGAGASKILFCDSSAINWTGTVQVWNWTGTEITGGGADQLLFGQSSGGGLTSAQLANIIFYSDSGSVLVNMPGAAYASGVPGEVVPTPEPSSVVSLMTGIAGLLGLHRSRRRR